jgi:hypothetical protein
VDDDNIYDGSGSVLIEIKIDLTKISAGTSKNIIMGKVWTG